MTDKYGNLFAKDASEYKRDCDVLGHYVTQASQMLHISTGFPIEECREYVKTQIRPDGRFALQDPTVVFFHRQPNGDRQRRKAPLSRFLSHTLENNELLAPTFTTYVHPAVKESVLSGYADGNVKLRGKAKKQMFAAIANKEELVAAVKKVEQTGRKLGNNAISGAFNSASTPLYNPTAHSTLTSTCRSTSGYGNANNEKFLSGNRHYFHRDIVINNIISVTGNVNYEELQALVDKYGLHIPTVDEVMSVIEFSTQFYWWNSAWMQDIRDLVSKLDGLQRAAFCYVGDAYHLLRFNQDFMRVFLTKLSNKVVGQVEDPVATIKKMPDSYINLAHQICFEESVSCAPNDYKKILGTQALQTIACTAENIADVVFEYRDLVGCLWMTTNVPASVAHFPDSIRRSALTSDTDSTIFTVQDWVQWYSGKISFDERSRGVYAAVVFLTSSTITHVLAMMSANFGIVADRLFQIAMKSEFTFDVFVPTELGKHYYAAISCQEGLVFDELEYEIKGAQLKSANSPREVIKDATEMMKSIIHDVRDHGTISITKYLNWVADAELRIIDAVSKGALNYFRSTSIKDAGSYAGEKEDSPFANHFLWQSVFAPKYGRMPEPPYDTLKISVTTDTPTKVKAWLNGLEDRDFAARVTAYMVKNEKTNFTTFNLPKEVLQSSGIPKEVVAVVDVEKIVVDICKIYYLLLETLGYYALGKKTKRLLSSEGWGTLQSKS